MAFRAGITIEASPGPGPPLLLVVEGVVARVAQGPQGGDIAYGLLRAGDLGGVDALGTPGEGLALVAWTRVDVLIWPTGVVHDLAEGDGGLAMDLLEITLTFAGALAEELVELRGVPSLTRLARLLLRYGDLLVDPRRTVLRRNHLATLMGTSREMMERCLRQLERDRVLVRTTGGGLVLLDESALQRIADTGPLASLATPPLTSMN